MFDVQFANKEYLYALLIIPILALIFALYLINRKRAIEKIGKNSVLAPLMPEVSTSKPILRFILICLALSCLIVAAARPRMGSKMTETTITGSEIMVLLDVSNSMRATDMYPNRLENAKNSISNFIKKLNGDKIGLIIFAGEAYVQVPMTCDMSASDIFVQSVKCDMISLQGTALGAAINLGIKSFTQDSETSKAMILITDGENHETSPDPLKAAKDAKDRGIVVHTVGLGSARGVPIPVRDGSSDFMKDRSGQIVLTKLDESTLIDIAQTTGGIYCKATNSDAGFGKIYKEIENMQKSEIAVSYAEYDEKYAFPAFLGLIFFVAACFTLNRKNRWIAKMGIFD